MRRTLATAASALVALAPTLASAEPPPPPPMPRLALTYSALTVLRVNPLGLQFQGDLGLQLRLWDSESVLLRDSFVGLSFSPLLTPAFLSPAVSLKLQPLALLRLEARYAWLGYLGTFDLVQSYDSPAADFSDTAIKARGDTAYSTTGTSLTLTAELRAKVSKLAARSRLSAVYQDLEVRAGDRVWYDQYYDLLAGAQGWLVVNDLDVLWQQPLDEATGEMLMLGARYSFGLPLYGADDYAPGQAQAHDNGPFHRLGPMAVYTFYDEPGAAFSKPSIIVLVNWHLAHRWRTGEDVSAALPYIVLGFAFTGEVWRLAAAD